MPESNILPPIQIIIYWAIPILFFASVIFLLTRRMRRSKMHPRLGPNLITYLVWLGIILVAYEVASIFIFIDVQSPIYLYPDFELMDRIYAARHALMTDIVFLPYSVRFFSLPVIPFLMLFGGMAAIYTRHRSLVLTPKDPTLPL